VNRFDNFHLARILHFRLILGPHPHAIVDGKAAIRHRVTLRLAPGRDRLAVTIPNVNDGGASLLAYETTVN
jgi:hypothetical protein